MNKSVGLFGTCRVSSLGDDLDFVCSTKSRLTGGGGGLGSIFKAGSYYLECHPFNYTTKLSDCVDSLRYLRGGFLDGRVSANYDYDFFRLFCRGFHDDCFFNREIAEPGSFKGYDFIVFEICSLRKILITTSRFGEHLKGSLLPWNINVEPCHQKFSAGLDDFQIVEPSLSEIESSFDALAYLAGCPIMIIGPYLLPYEPTGRSLHGENDYIPIDKINSNRLKVANTLKSLCIARGVEYFDMTDHLSSNPSLLRNQYHFSLAGEKIMLDAIRLGINKSA